MKIVASEVQMDSAARRLYQYESKQNALIGDDELLEGEQGNFSNGVIVGISENAKLKYQQELEQYAYRSSDISLGATETKNTDPTEAKKFRSSDFVRAAADVVLQGNKAASRVAVPVNAVAVNAVAVNAVAVNAVPVNVAAANVVAANAVSANSIQAVGEQVPLEVPGNNIINVTTMVEDLNLQPLTARGSGLMRVEQYTRSYTEQSQIYNGYGTVSTSDGRVINFGLYLAMERSETIETSSELLVNVSPMVDPLVINFGSESATLNDQFFEFDIDSDGVAETIATLGKGSGYLMLDRNGNGSVDDGSELFGPATGRGFEELAEFDHDGNLWIDESDPVFDQLKVWVTDEQGNDSLLTLKETGVGAIYLGSSAADFDLVSREGLPLGNIKANGVMLMENGEVRSVQEIDLVDHTEENRQPNQPKVMSEEDIEDEIKNFALQAESDGAAEEEAEAGLIRISPDVAEALERLNNLREEQKAYSESLREEQEERKSVTELIIEAMNSAVFQKEPE
ncbi:hypothetical protein [Litoribacillus peritrichatus]|uniref:Uncharacterized protein n=1 Tax=Litoribacillus peritrichatus TaxID=718191 RepID=A0ABP7MEQ7_9GAMM